MRTGGAGLGRVDDSPLSPSLPALPQTVFTLGSGAGYHIARNQGRLSGTTLPYRPVPWLCCRTPCLDLLLKTFDFFLPKYPFRLRNQTIYPARGRL
jgi:hypothetical protein